MATPKRVGVLLSGCGFLDGAEVQEGCCTLLSLDRRGAKLVAMAPDVPQHHVVDHLLQQPAAGQARNVLAESARLVRGQLTDLARVSAAELDALILPGGFGVAKNLCSFAFEGKQMRVLPAVEGLVRAMRAAGKPMGFICIAPVVAAKVLGGDKVKVTIGNDPETAAAIESWGARHVPCRVDEIAIDEKLKVVSTPAYMLGPWIADVAEGIDKLVAAVLALA
jgi:enhancing lycopene biosynthesis protein 2